MAGPQQIVEEDGVLCAFIATKDGFTIDAAVSEEVKEEVGEVDPEHPAAVSSTILLRVKNLMEQLVSPREEVTISVVGGHSLVLKEVQGYFIVGLLYDSERITEGLARMLLQQLEEAAQRFYEESGVRGE